MKKSYKFNGSAYVLVIMVFIFVSLFSALMVSTINHSVFQTNAYGMQMQCYYLNNQASKATVAALLADDNDLLKKVDGEQRTSMFHKDTSDVTVGRSVITIKKEYHEYYGENKDWIVARITTYIPDRRASRSGDEFSYQGTVMVLVENPLIQLFNLRPEDF